MSDKVYCVSSGSYSDYSVSCCFTTQALAIEYAAKRNGLSVEDQERWLELDESRWSAAVERERELIERRAPYHLFFVEVFDLHDALPIVEDSP